MKNLFALAAALRAVVRPSLIACLLGCRASTRAEEPGTLPPALVAALEAAIGAAPWGPQGAAFVTDRAEVRFGRDVRVRTLWISRRPIAAVRERDARDHDLGLPAGGGGWILDRVWTREGGVVARAEARAEAREKARDYALRRDAVVGALRERPWALSFVRGQKGGTFRLGDAKPVSAPGALRRAFGPAEGADIEGRLDEGEHLRDLLGWGWGDQWEERAAAHGYC